MLPYTDVSKNTIEEKMRRTLVVGGEECDGA